MNNYIQYVTQRLFAPLLAGKGRRWVALSVFLSLALTSVTAQEISYAGTPRQCIIAGLAIKGVEGQYEDYLLTNLSGLQVGQTVDLPGNDITEAVKRYWNHGLFSKVSITVDSIVGQNAYLSVNLALRPRITAINYYGVKKTEREDLESKLGIMKGSSVTPNIIDRAKILALKYFEDKGFKNAEIEITQRDDVAATNSVILDVNIDKKEKMKVKHIIFEGNEVLKSSTIKGGMFTKGAFGKVHEAGKFTNMFKAKKFTPERYAEAKQKLVERYNEMGFRDMAILEDSIWTYDDKHVCVLVKIEEGQRYFLRNIN